MNFLNHQFKALGSICEFKLYLEETEAPRVFAYLEELVLGFQAKYSRYRDDSITAQINQHAGSLTFVEVDEETASLLNYADNLFEQSDGLFDITSGILRRVWDFSSNTLPREEHLASILPKIGWQKVERKNHSIRLPEKGMEIDFGGYVKEYIADVCATHCMNMHINHGLINLGGDVRIIGPHPNGESWKVGIQHPRQPGKAIATIDVPHGAVATSGDYERFMIIGERRYCHILNPHTGKSIRPWYSGLSVVAEHCLIAGSFTTIGLMKSETNKNWIAESGLPWLGVDQEMKLHGELA